MKAIETRYNGHRFRSRLEARWAVFFDHLGIPYEYEVEGFELASGKRYLPDFRITISGKSHWFEVKGKEPEAAEVRTCQEFADQSDDWVFLAAGTMDVPSNAIEGFRGAKIYGFSPQSAWERLPDDPHVRRMLRVNSALIFYGFYEDMTGDIQLDHLYAEDVPFAPWDADSPRLVSKLSVIGVMPAAYIGEGRLYRSERIVQAYAAARSARFEFGESGAG